MRLRLIISYDGAPFLGWQSQLKGDTVQGVVERAFFKIVGRRVIVHGASRTDAGVHALAQCAHADIPDGRMDLSDWRRALNANLPGAVRILKVLQTASSFHARFASIGKIYRYRIWNSEVLPPLERGRVWHVPNFLDFGALRSNVTLFEGRHNFVSFAVNGSNNTDNTVRTLRTVQISRCSGGEVRLTFEGEGFLYKMIRVLTGTLVRLGQKKEDIGWVSRLLLGSSVKRRKSLCIAPAQGLYLVRVLYGRKPKC
ncbi:tRNA pseudouridine synthase A [Candidatus Xiphinematobacter sp. Idaho Grape]|nr:tRNA pseudouridine synthase A [Candidatus Xiphinematobacter sp. Idaho Grape]